MTKHAMWIAVCLTLGCAGPVAAVELHWDQFCQPKIMGAYSVSFYQPIGQEFLPSYSQVDVVDLYLIASITNDSTQVRVRLHHDTIDGPIVGTSDVVTLRQTMDGVVRFTFAPPAPTTPTERHVIEVEFVGGAQNTMLGGGDSNGYAPGRPVLSGQFLMPNDFWFRTGVDRLVPVRQRTWGGVKSAYR